MGGLRGAFRGLVPSGKPVHSVLGLIRLQIGRHLLHIHFAFGLRVVALGLEVAERRMDEAPDGGGRMSIPQRRKMELGMVGKEQPRQQRQRHEQLKRQRRDDCQRIHPPARRERLSLAGDAISR